ncbi:MAG: hypothetical protein LUC93_08170 [Planctomycetaceae bacterium]|nr:hypothetical protein [Planctomycetaceae bacterium]
MKSTYILASDIGGSSVKSMLFDLEKRTIVAVATKPLHLFHPTPEATEYDADEIFMACVDGMKEFLDSAGGRPADVAAIISDGQQAGIIWIDENYDAVSPYDTWMDNRFMPFVAQMNDACGQRILEKGGNNTIITTGPKILWWKKNRPDVYARARKFVLTATYVGGKLAGLKADDAYFENTSTGYSGLIDYGIDDWDREICSICGIDADKLPLVSAPTRIVGSLVKRYADAIGIPDGIPVVCGAGDFPAACIAAGILSPGQVGDTAGTASMFTVCSDHWRPDPSGLVRTLKSPIPGYWYAFCFTTGGGSVKWFLENVVGDTSQGNTLSEEAKVLPPGAEGLGFYPYIGGTYRGLHVGGAFSGIQWVHGKPHMLRAILEAVAFEYKEYATGLQNLLGMQPFTVVRGSGGGSTNFVWNQIKANVLNAQYENMQEEECSLLGSAIIAGNAIGYYPDMMETAASFNSVAGRFEPEREKVEQYKSIHAKWHDLKERCYEIFQSL